MRYLGIIPARGGSKEIPKKNIKDLGGRPLISYTINAALKSNVDKVIVSTDCDQISKICSEYEIEVVKRPKKLGSDTTPTLPVLRNVIKNLSNRFDAIITLQPTSPFRTSNHINESISIFENGQPADSLVSVVKVPHNYAPEKVMKFDGKYLSGNMSPKRRQETKRLYARNGAAIYITKYDVLDKFIFGGKILPYFMNKLDSLDIDDNDDWKLAELLLRNIYK